MRRLVGSALAVSFMLATFSLFGTLLAAPASAAVPWAGCEHGEICLSEHANGYGAVYSSTFLAHPNLHNAGWGDRASAAWNRSGRTIYLYRHTIPTTSQDCLIRLTPYGRQVNLLPSWANDQVSQYGYLGHHRGACHATLG